MISDFPHDDDPNQEIALVASLLIAVNGVSERINPGRQNSWSGVGRLDPDVTGRKTPLIRPDLLRLIPPNRRS